MASGTQTTITGFSPEDGSEIKPLGSTDFENALAVFSALRSDGNGGAILDLPRDGSIDFLNTAPSSFASSDFAFSQS
jgi:hypothetical protein